MKYTCLLSTLACAAIVSLATSTFAAPPENNDPAARKAEMLKKFDKNGDGKLNDEEKSTLRVEMQNRRRGKDRKQWTPEQRNEMLKKFDKDGDGELSDAEKTTLRAEIQNRRGGRDRKQWTPEQRDEMLKKFDTDRDGKLSQEEQDTAREAMKASRTKGEKQQKKND